MLRGGTWPVMIVVALAAAGCSIVYFNPATFAREAELFAGEIHGVAVLADVEGQLEPAAYAQVKVRGTSQARRADENGRFVVWDLTAGAWVLQLSLDDDGDGLPDRRRITSTILREAPHADGVIPLVGPQTTRVTGVSVGDVVLEGTAAVGGTVLLTPTNGGAPQPPASLDRNVVVLAARDFDLPRVAEGGFDPVSLGAEARTHVDDDGAFVLKNLGSGFFYLVFLVYERVADVGDPSRLKRVSPQLYVRALPNGTTSLDEPVILPADAAPGETGTAQLLVAPAPPSGEELFLMVAPPGRAFPGCDFPPDVDEGEYPYVWVSDVVAAAAQVTIPGVPVGSWDLKVCTSTGSFGQSGVLQDETILALPDDAIAPLKGPVLVAASTDACRRPRRCNPDADEDTCPGELTCQGPRDEARCETAEGGLLFDCDGDGRRGLPPLDDDSSDDDRGLWQACGEACTAGAGASIADAVCEADGNTYDCDDDGDGQADVTEGQRCYGLGLGGDADSDGLCDPTDAFPQCRANTAEECEAGADDGPEVIEPDDPGNVDLDPCAVTPPPERVQGELFSTYCGLGGDDGTTCQGYSMTCAFETPEGPPRELYPRLCASDADCAPPPADGSFVTVECNGETGQCEYVADASRFPTCDQLQCWDVFPMFLCVEDLDVRCVPQANPPADMPCVCTSPEGSVTRVVGALVLDTDTCSEQRALGLWTSVCEFDAPFDPNATADAGPPGDDGGLVDIPTDGGTGQAVCQAGEIYAQCTGNGEEIEHCSLAETGLLTDCASLGGTCREYLCVDQPCNFIGDACRMPPGARCNDHVTTSFSEPLLSCGGDSCRMSLLQGDPSPIVDQQCAITATNCFGETQPTCSALYADTVEQCVSTGGDVPAGPRLWDCGASGASCAAHPTFGFDVCLVGAADGRCDPDWAPDTPGTYPFVCDAAQGLTCQRAVPGDRYGTCQQGGFDAGP